MNIRLGDMSAAEAIGLANQSYRSAVSAGDTAFSAAAVADANGGFNWAVFLANIVKPQNAASAPVQAPAKSVFSPYLVAGGAALLAILALK